MEGNRDVFDRAAGEYTGRALDPPELRLLQALRGRWHLTDMLDLGVGAGRTAHTFAAVARSYLGLDYAPRMVEACRAGVGEGETVRFAVGDARDLAALPAGGFGAVLFSFNGIDYVGPADRVRVLRGVRRVLTPGGLFLFSAHSLAAYPYDALPPAGRRGGVRGLYRWARGVGLLARRRVANRGRDLAAMRAAGWGVLRDEAHGFGLETVYVLPAFQVAQLAEAGFRVLAVYDPRGEPADPAAPPPDAHISYLCTTAGWDGPGWYRVPPPPPGPAG